MQLRPSAPSAGSLEKRAFAQGHPRPRFDGESQTPTPQRENRVHHAGKPIKVYRGRSPIWSYLCVAASSVLTLVALVLFVIVYNAGSRGVPFEMRYDLAISIPFVLLGLAAALVFYAAKPR